VTSGITHIDPPRTRGVNGVDGLIRAVVNVTVDPVGEGHAEVDREVDRGLTDVTGQRLGLRYLRVDQTVRSAEFFDDDRTHRPSPVDRACRGVHPAWVGESARWMRRCLKSAT
jgi:hypothetical protein